MDRTEQEREELKEAVRQGIIEALKSEEAQEAVLGAVGTWFDKQSGKAARKLLAALALAIIISIAGSPALFKSWLSSWGK